METDGQNLETVPEKPRGGTSYTAGRWVATSTSSVSGSRKTLNGSVVVISSSSAMPSAFSAASGVKET